MSCDEGHCVTCSDEGIPMRVVALNGCRDATCIDGTDEQQVVALDLVWPVRPGDELLVHAGVAIGRLRAGEL